MIDDADFCVWLHIQIGTIQDLLFGELLCNSLDHTNLANPDVI